MPLILSIETATRAFSVALHQDKQLLGCFDVHVEKSHSRVITIAIDKLLDFSNKDIRELDAVAVSKGPGSYTGLRIGVSTAKGLCYALEKPLISVNTLEAMAYQVNQQNLQHNLVCPMIDARRMEVYCAVFDHEGRKVLDTQAKVLDSFSFADLLENNRIIFFGDGAEKVKNLFSTDNALFLKENIFPSARYIGYLAEDLYTRGVFEDVAYFEPYYLKEFVSTGGKNGK